VTSSVLVESADAVPRRFSQRVPEAKRVKNRVHLDLQCEDLEPGIARLTALGARVLDRRTDEDRVVLADPEGNEFCVCTQAGSIRSQALP
jgi:predicted enzyme related to lactoylglutathione lyase